MTLLFKMVPSELSLDICWFFFFIHLWYGYFYFSGRKIFFFRSHSHSDAVCRELNTNANGVLFNVSLCLANHSFVSVFFFSYPFSDLHHIFLLMTTRCGESEKWTFIIYSEKSSDSCCAAHESQCAQIEWPFLHLTFYKLPLWFYK